MPLYGTLDITQDLERLPTLPNLDTESWALPKAEMLQLLIEVPRTTTERLLPKAMHPALPSYVGLAVTKYSDSPVGPFNLAMLRLGSRAGAHPRGFLLGAVASTEAAARELRARWGFPVESGEVKFLRRHDRVMGTVRKNGRTILDCALVDPQPVSGTDVQYINWVTAANAPLDGQTQPMLIQVDPKYTFYKAERGKPQVGTFDAAAWNAEGVTLADPIVGTCCTVDTDLPRIRFVMDPLKPVFQGTRRIRESRVDE
jgi:hypothetical protein